MTKHVMRSILSAALLLSIVPSPIRGQGRGGPPVTLPEGAGKDLVQMNCTRCHGLNMITNDGYTRAEWITVFNTMVDLPKDQSDAVADYLAANFPEKPKPAAVVVPGSVKVSFKEWPVPTKGSRPHDPIATPDNALWYTGQFANKLGRVDLKTGQIREFPLTTPASGPHA